MFNRQAIYVWTPVALWAALIWTFSSIPELRSGFLTVIDFALRKLAHMAEFGILALLLFRASRKTNPQRSPNVSLVFAGLSALLYAATDEMHQTLTLGRQGSPIDVGIDTIGVVLALWWRQKTPQGWGVLKWRGKS